MQISNKSQTRADVKNAPMFLITLLNWDHRPAFNFINHRKRDEGVLESDLQFDQKKKRYARNLHWKIPFKISTPS